MDEYDKKPVVYAGIIDSIGRRLYSGNVTWIREYIQNAIDSGATSIEIRLHERDFEIDDNGQGMDKDSVIKEAFSIGKSFKEKDQIGELGIGMYAGSGICDKIVVRTKKKGSNICVARLDMEKYRDNNNGPNQLEFNKMMDLIFDIDEDSNLDEDSSFTQIRFEDLNQEVINLIEKANLKQFLEDTINVPISDNFPHKKDIEKFLAGTSKEINITLDMNGKIYDVKKFDTAELELSNTFWHKDIKDKDQKLIAKMWAIYNKAGISLPDARILLKAKGITVGDQNTVERRFSAKYSRRFYGEIVLLDNRIEINSSRDWFISSPYLSVFVDTVKTLLNELWGIANFDSRYGVGITNLIKKEDALIVKADEDGANNNIGLAEEDKREAEKIDKNIIKKVKEAQKFRDSISNGEVDRSDPTNQIKIEIITRTLDAHALQKYLEIPLQKESDSIIKKSGKNPFPKIVRSFLQENVIDRNLALKIGNGDAKATSNNAFTFIEHKLKEMLGRKEEEHRDIGELLQEFKKKYKPLDIKGQNLEKYMQSFDGVVNGMFFILRNRAAHSFMDDMNNTRNIFEIIMISDFIVNWLDKWTIKDQ